MGSGTYAPDKWFGERAQQRKTQKTVRIISPMARGNGAYVVHGMLEHGIPGYRLCGYDPKWTVLPPALSLLCRDKSADIVHTTPDYGYFFRNKHAATILTFHNFVLDAFMGSFSSAAQKAHYRTDLRLFTKKALKKARSITAVSRYTASLVQKELGYKGQIRVVYNGIDTKKFTPATKRRSGPIRVLFSGNLTRRKGADLLPGIARKLHQGIVLQYTRGLRTRKTSFDVSELQDIGAIENADMPKVYQDADLVLLPTVREGHSLAVLEAMASGLPVVATDCSSLPEQIVDGKGGFLCEMGNAEDFAARINQLADSPRSRIEMGQFNRQKIEEDYTIAKMTHNYTQLFEEVLNQ